MIRRCSESKVEEKPNIKCNVFQSGLDSLTSSSEETGGLWTGGSSVRVATCTPYAFQHFYFPVFMYDKGRAEALHRWRKNNPAPKQVPLITVTLTFTVFFNLFFSLFTDEDQDVSNTCSIIHSFSQNLLLLMGTIFLWPRLRNVTVCGYWATEKAKKTRLVTFPLPATTKYRRVHRCLHGHHDSASAYV